MSLERLQAVRSALKERLIDRDGPIDGVLLALLCRQHVLLLGPPGTAKSMLARMVCSTLSGADYFEWLLTKFSTPEELFGPISLQALQAGRYERVVDGKLPLAHVAFLDEVFKANSAILNALLTVMNERRYHDGTTTRDLPLLSVVAASNELPDEDELAALYDRFLLRFTIGYVESDAAFTRLLTLPDPKDDLPAMSLEALAELQDRVPTIDVPKGVIAEVGELRRRLAKEGIVPSDRRFRTSLRVLQAAALLEGRDRVVPADLGWLRHVLWSDPEEQSKVDTILAEVATGTDEEARKLADQAKEVYAYARRNWPDETSKARAALEAHTKLHDIERRLEHLIQQVKERGRDAAELVSLRDQIDRLQLELLGSKN